PVTLELVPERARGRIPHSRDVVPSARDEEAAVGAERDRRDHGALIEALDGLPGYDVEEARGPVGRRDGHEAAAVRAEDGRLGRSLLAQAAELRPGGRIPDHNVPSA